MLARLSRVSFPKAAAATLSTVGGVVSYTTSVTKAADEARNDPIEK